MLSSEYAVLTSIFTPLSWSVSPVRSFFAGPKQAWTMFRSWEVEVLCLLDEHEAGFALSDRLLVDAIVGRDDTACPVGYYPLGNDSPVVLQGPMVDRRP